MKCLVLILFTFYAIATAERETSMFQITLGLSRAFSIPQKEAEKCIHKMGATAADLDLLDDVVIDKLDADKDSVRRATCAVTCCAQVQGTMIGAKLNLPAIQKVIQDSDMPARLKSQYFTAINECEKTVTNITDECEVGLEFMRCLVNKSWDHDY